MPKSLYTSEVLMNLKDRVHSQYLLESDMDEPDIIVSNKRRLSINIPGYIGNAETISMERDDIITEATVLTLYETFNDLLEDVSYLNENDIITEGVKTGLRKVKDKVTNTVVKYTVGDKRLSDQLNEKFNRFLNMIRQDQKSNAYDKYVKDTVNLSQTLKNFFGSVLLGTLIPGGIPVKLVSAAIAMAVKVAIDRRVNDKYKQTILNDLRFELKVTQEKIQDANVRGDTRAKYRLIRIENQLQRAIQRIKYNLAQTDV